MKRRAILTYMEKDCLRTEDFVFYIDERCLSDEYFQQSPNVQNLHWHDYFEMEIVLSGEGKHHFNDTVYDLHPGSAYIVTPIDFHSVAFDNSRKSKVIHIQFDTFTMSEAVSRLITTSPAPITVVFDKEELEYIKILTSKLLAEYKNDSSDRKIMIRALLEQLCILTLRKVEPMSNTGRPKARDETILQVVNYLNYNFRSKVSLRNVAMKFLMNPNYLGEKFFKTLGISFTTYVNDLRLNYSMRLLKNSELSIKQISEESGFSSVSYFIKLFSDKYGDAPQRMRKKI